MKERKAPSIPKGWRKDPVCPHCGKKIEDEHHQHGERWKCRCGGCFVLGVAYKALKERL